MLCVNERRVFSPKLPEWASYAFMNGFRPKSGSFIFPLDRAPHAGDLVPWPLAGLGYQLHRFKQIAIDLSLAQRGGTQFGYVPTLFFGLLFCFLYKCVYMCGP